MSEIFSGAGRQWLKEKFPEQLKDLLACEHGWLDSECGAGIDDEFVLTNRLKIVPTTDKSDEIRVEIQSESAISSAPAKARVFRGEALIAEITGKTEPKKGADGSYYECVTLIQTF